MFWIVFFKFYVEGNYVSYLLNFFGIKINVGVFVLMVIVIVLCCLRMNLILYVNGNKDFKSLNYL